MRDLVVYEDGADYTAAVVGLRTWVTVEQIRDGILRNEHVMAWAYVPHHAPAPVGDAQALEEWLTASVDVGPPADVLAVLTGRVAGTAAWIGVQSQPSPVPAQPPKKGRLERLFDRLVRRKRT